MKFMENIYVFGHRNPDTDSVCGAIALSYLKRQLDFFKNHRKAYSMEEYKNYIERRKECEKRLKDNNDGKTTK